ncbi:hypothetical protein [Oceanobacillus neutriphilus]|uniref:Uncharacterized protein n=1 Tax=Oceanobacillus neutriphilus TaxID=531815 RepID=A0ABQ2NS77_9BACI|nr:hypothetical protein [Oceanobacillus neutriphilus]GGP09391.1 hypothetical protein GCM10011346_13270 [Oceanobacillus neutriphilus]
MSNFFLNSPANFNQNEKGLGDKLLYYGGVITTFGSIMSLVGSTILYNEDIEEETAFEEDTPVTSRQLVEMQQQLALLQQKIDRLENQGQ